MIYEFEPFIVKKYVKKFITAYRADGKAAAGLVLSSTPKPYKSIIIKQIRKELNI